MNISKNHVYWALNYYHFVNDGIVFLIPIITAIYFQKFQLSYTEISILFTIHTLFVVMTQIVVGKLVDLNHEALVYIIGSIFTSISTFTLLFPRDFLSLFILVVFNGIGLGFVHSILYVNGAKLFPTNRERKMAIQGAMGDFGKVVAVFSTIIIDFLNPELWPLTLIIWGILAVGIIIFGIIVMPNFSFSTLNKAAEAQLNDSSNQRAGTIKALLSRELILLILLLIVYSGSYDVVVKPLIIFFQQERTGLSASYAKILFGIFMIFGTMGAYASGPLKIRFGLKRYITIMYGIMGVVLLCFIIFAIDSLISDIIFSALLGFLILSIYIAIQSELSYFMHSSQMGIGYALIFGFGWGGGVLFVTIAGPIADYFHSSYIYLFIGLILCSITILLVQFAPKRKTDREI